MKILILENQILIPIGPASQIQPQPVSRRQHIAHKMVEAVKILPIDRVGHHIHGSAGVLVVLALPASQGRFALMKEFLLSGVAAMALQDSAIVILDHLVENFLQIGVTSRELRNGVIRKSCHVV